MKQKVWLITGVSKGLGREIAKQVAATGDIVIGTVRTATDKAAFETELDATAQIIDMAHTGQIAALTAAIIQEHGQIDVLVNNAGYGAFGMIFRLPLTSGTIDLMKAKIVESQKCITQTEEIARSIDY